MLAVAALLAIVASATGFGWWRAARSNTSSVAAPMRLTIEQPDGASISATSYSVDISSVARRVAFTARDSVGIVRVYVRAFDDVQWQRLDGTEGVQQLYFSPDGAWIAFAANGKLKKIPATGGSAILLADITNVVDEVQARRVAEGAGEWRSGDETRVCESGQRSLGPWRDRRDLRLVDGAHRSLGGD